MDSLSSYFPHVPELGLLGDQLLLFHRGVRQPPALRFQEIYVEDSCFAGCGKERHNLCTETDVTALCLGPGARATADWLLFLAARERRSFHEVAAQYLHVRLTMFDGAPPTLFDAARGALLFQQANLAKLRKNLLGGVFADMAGVEHDEIGALHHRRFLIAFFRKHIGHARGVIDIHLTAVGLHKHLALAIIHLRGSVTLRLQNPNPCLG